MKGSVRKRGENWSYYFTIGVIDGKRKIKEKGGFRTKKEAQTALREAISDFETQGFIQQKSDYTLYEFIDYWQETVASTYLKQSTLELYESIARTHIKEEIGHIKIDKVTPIILQKYFSKKLKNETKIGTVQNIKKVLNNSLKLAVKQGYIKQNPLLSVEIKHTPVKKEKHILTQDEIEIIFEKIKQTKYHIPYFIALHTGMRLGEILGLLWEDIDFEKNRIDINKSSSFTRKDQLSLTTTKTVSSNRNILMTKQLTNMLIQWKETQEELIRMNKGFQKLSHHFVCTDEDGEALNPKAISRYTSKMAQQLNIPFKFHDFRHTHATLLLESGVNIKVIQERLGHSNIATTLGIYSHVTKAGEEDAISKLESKF